MTDEIREVFLDGYKMFFPAWFGSMFLMFGVAFGLHFALYNEMLLSMAMFGFAMAGIFLINYSKVGWRTFVTFK